jgi:putative ABC transport system permease protein
MSNLLQDLRYGFRMLIKGRGITAAAVFALAIGIGANTAIFSIIDTVLLRPLAFPESERLITIFETNESRGFSRLPVTAANFADWRRASTTFEDMAVFRHVDMNLTGSGDPVRIRGWRVSSHIFHVLGVEPFKGRSFLTEEGEPGKHRVVILGHAFWNRRFGADPDILGKSLLLDEEEYVVVGVMPPDFKFPPYGSTVNFWKPLSLTPEELDDRTMHYLEAIGRLEPGITLDQAQADMDTIAARHEREYPDTNEGFGVRLVPLHESLVGDVQPALVILLGAVGFVLLIACANVTNLLLARATARSREMAVRSSLGASRVRLFAQQLSESISLALVGGGLGLILAYWGVDAIPALIPGRIPRLDEVGVDMRILAFTSSLSILTGVLFGMAPAWRASRCDLVESLKEGVRSSGLGRGSRRLRGVLVVAEIAVAVVLLIGAGLLIQSFIKLLNVDPGFRAENVLTFRLSLPESRYTEGHERARFFQEMLQGIESLPGVDAAGGVTNIPIGGGTWQDYALIEGRAVESIKDLSLTSGGIATMGYFRAMGIPLLAGRTFNERDVAGSLDVAIVSETMVRRFWADENPIGKRFKQGRPEDEVPWLTVVGVVGDVKRYGLTAEIEPEVYLPHGQDPRGSLTLAVRARSDPADMVGAIKSKIGALDSILPISSVRTMEQVVSTSVARPRFSMFLLTLFAAVAVVSAVVGVYGVLSYLVSQRTHEIGVRMALGAQTHDVLMQTIGQGMRKILMGIVTGLVGAYFLTRLMAGLLFEVSTTDPVTFAGVAVVLAMVALAACYLPARRASNIDPMIALRNE